jgi:hypothetical protein
MLIPVKTKSGLENALVFMYGVFKMKIEVHQRYIQHLIK